MTVPPRRYRVTIEMELADGSATTMVSTPWIANGEDDHRLACHVERDITETPNEETRVMDYNPSGWESMTVEARYLVERP